MPKPMCIQRRVAAAARRIAALFVLFALPDTSSLAALDTTPGQAATAEWRVLSQTANSLRLEFRLPELRRQSVEVGAETYVTLGIDRGGIVGAQGTPGLPVVGHLVAVPDGARVEARIVAAETLELPAGRLLPIQRDDARPFAVDSGAYTRPGWVAVPTAADGATLVTTAGGGGPTVTVGKPVMIAGQSVVPLSVAPVAYEPVSGRIVAARRVEIELLFTEPRGPLAAGNGRTTMSPALAATLGDHVLGLPQGRDVGVPGDSPGTWAVVCRNSSVLTHLQPLVAWRARQGYHVETIVSTGTAASIKSQLQALYDNPALPPLSFIVLAGDTDGTYGVATWYEALSGYNGEGDHDYTTLDGDDILADAHVGRLSFTDLAMLDRIVAKIIAYETNPPMDQTDWYTEACVIGDPSESGMTTIWVNQWLKGQLLAHGYTAVDTIWSGNFVTQMMASVNAGKSAFGYRGYLGMSGITTAHIEALSNGGRLPVAILPTCDTGSFDGSITCESEAWLRASGGAIAAVGTATTGTHTRYNNCYYEGIWDGLLNAGEPRVGAAHTLGKLELFTNYYLAEPDEAEIWAVWNNIMGDPATSIWLGVPRSLTVSHAALVSVATGAVAFTVTSSGEPVAGARVCLFRAGAVQVSGLTDAAGQVLLATPPLAAGSHLVTVSGPGLLPYLGAVQVGVVDVACSLCGQLLDDSAGNGDGTLNPGETVALGLAINNHGTSVASAVSGELTGGGPWTTITSAHTTFGDVLPGVQVWSQSPAVITVDPAAPDGTTVSWPLSLASGGNTWISIVQTTVHAAAFAVADLAWSAGATFEPGQTGSLVLTLRNDGSLDAAAVSGTLVTDSPWLQITSPTAGFGSIDVGATGQNALAPFQIAIDEGCLPGHLAVLRLTLDYNGGLQTSTEFPVTVGEAATDDPTGPGAGGYYAFDDTDTDSWYAPVFEWVALDPAHGGPGVDLGLTDFGFEQDDTRTVDLPFTFRFYGTDFDHVSICSNGWLAMGETPLVTYRNYAIPAKGSPGSLIAPFWDDLYQSGNAGIYTHYDPDRHRFIVQWYNLRNDFAGSIENFEVILLDPAWHPTVSGDGAIIFQYATVANNDSRDGYATVGIQNPDRTGGLLYSYWNQNAAGAAPLAAGRAIRFQPLGAIVLPSPSVEPASFAATVPPGGQTQRTLHIANAGAAESLLGYTIDTVDPQTLPPDGIATASSRDIQGSTLSLATDQYEPGTTVDIVASVHAVSMFGFLTVVHLQLPAGVTLNTAENFHVGASNRLFWRNQVGDGVLTTWDGHQGGYVYYIANGTTATATLNVTFESQLSGDLAFDYMLEDEGIIGEPDQVFGTVVLTTDTPTVAVLAPDAGAVAVIGQELSVEFVTYNGSGLVDIALQRDPVGPWQELASAVDSAPGVWAWTVTGQPGPYARIRISDAQDPGIAGTSGAFVVSRDVSWVELAQANGAVPGGGEHTIALTLQAADLSEGSYEAMLVISTSSGQTFWVPIDLLVDSATTVGEKLPAAVTLLGNHPNPFNPATVIGLALPRSMPVTLDVFAANGRRVRRLLDDTAAAGTHYVAWDGTDQGGRAVASGVYIYRLVTEDGTAVDKMLLAK
jgi:hypothetical protein